MVNHIYDESADATLCREVAGPMAYGVSTALYLEGDDTIPGCVSCNLCIHENAVRFAANPTPDVVNQPDHYTSHPSGVECIQITEHMNFLLGNAIKYIWRADLKGKAVEDLRKSVYYINREIARREKEEVK